MISLLQRSSVDVKTNGSGDRSDYDNFGLRVMEFGRLGCWLGLYHYTLFLDVFLRTVLSCGRCGTPGRRYS
jgi:hypothetical protein